MKMTKEIDGIKVRQVGEAVLTVSVEIDGGDVLGKSYAAVYVPAAKGAEALPLYAGPDEDTAAAAFRGAMVVLEAIAKARENRKSVASDD